MKEFALLLPELFLTLTLIGIIAGEASYHGERVRLIVYTALIGLAGAFAQILLTYRFDATPIFGGSLYIDGFALFFKLLFVVLAAFTVVGAHHSKEIPSTKQSEYIALVLAATVAMCLAASSADLLLMFLSIQAIHLISYFLVAVQVGSTRAAEAAVKQLIFSAVSAAFFLYGTAVLFLFTKSLNIYEIHQVLIENPMAPDMAHVVFALCFISLTFPLAAFPMNLVSPDVYEGAPTPTASFLVVGMRAAAFAVTLRFLTVNFAQPGLLPGQWISGSGLEWTRILALVSGLTMMSGALLALRQGTAKRLLSYLVISQSGFLLIGVLVLDQVGLSALLYNLLVELFSLIGLFYLLSFFGSRKGSYRLEDLNGSLQSHVPESIALLLFGASLVGLPPFPGFFGKFALIGVAVRHGWNFLALVAVVAMVIGVLAISKLAFSIVSEKNSAENQRSAETLVLGLRDVSWRNRRNFIALLLIPLLMMSIFSETVLSWTGQSLKFIFW